MLGSAGGLGRRTIRRACAGIVGVGAMVLGAIAHPSATAAASYAPIGGAGSTWSANALNQWISDVDQYGIRVNYAPTGSSDGRHQFLQGTVDFAASDIPFQSHPEDNSDPEAPKDGSYAYMPITAGGTSFMFNLTTSGGAQVTNLRLSGQNIAKIFTGVITNWDDPALAADNPSVTLPNLVITPVVRQDSAGTTFQLTSWMISQYPTLWSSYCQASGRAPHCAATSYYPKSGHTVSQSGDLGVAGDVSQASAAGAIGYVNYSYALNARMPVVKMLNASGYFNLPTPSNVAVSLLKAQIETANRDPQYYLTQKLDGVYTDTDPRTYPLSSYSYVILPTTTDGTFTTDKGKTLSAFAYYAVCHGQREMTDLAYAPLPLDLVQVSFDQIKKIPGAVSQDINTCDNPTFQNGADTLASTAPMPPASDAQNPPAANGGGSNGGGGGPSGSASTDAPGTTPSASNPIIATVTDPVAGSITVTKTQGGLVSGPYRALPYGVQVSAPAASTASPISLRFDVAKTSLGQVDPAQLAVFRDGTLAAPCPGSAVASPDPCVTSQAADGGVVTVKVLTSHASTWTFGLPKVTRVAGNDRIATAIAVSKVSFPADGSASTVVLSRSDQFADALTGGPLAVAKHGPVLLTSPSGLDTNVQAEIQRVAPSGSTVYIVGGGLAVPPSVDATLTGLGYTVVRYAGNDRYETATIIADKGLGGPGTVLEVTGLDFPDALAATAAAAQVGGAVLLTRGSTMPAATTSYLAAHPAHARYALGGPAAAADAGATAIVGTDRYDTAVKVAKTFFPSPTIIGVASGQTFADGLVVSAATGLAKAPTVLVAADSLPGAVDQYLTSIGPSVTSVRVAGGSLAIADAVVQAIQTAITSAR